jgi:CheY-like chemotaxis protein
VLDYLKHQPEIRHIPVHMISGSDHRVQALRMGAAAYYDKPVDPAALEGAFRGIREFLDRRCRKLLVVEDDTRERETLGELLGGEDVDVTAVGSGEEALRALGAERFDCMVLDLTLSSDGPSGFGVLERLSSGGSYEGPPVVVYTGRDLSEQERAELDTYTDSVILKDADSIERLVEETSLHLHRDQSRLSTQHREMLRSVRVADPTLVGRRILVVDDDVRNVFALTNALENRGMSVVFAENAEDGIETLKSQAGIDLVLMDIMMPGMDGLEATRVIRGIEEFRDLPIVTLTAKAMTGDRERSLEAGASDYVTKPVDIDQLQSVIRSWLLR